MAEPNSDNERPRPDANDAADAIAAGGSGGGGLGRGTAAGALQCGARLRALGLIASATAGGGKKRPPSSSVGHPRSRSCGSHAEHGGEGGVEARAPDCTSAGAGGA